MYRVNSDLRIDCGSNLTSWRFQWRFSFEGFCPPPGIRREEKGTRL